MSAVLSLLLGVRSWREAGGLLPGVILAAAVMCAAAGLAGVAGPALLRAQGIASEGRPNPISAVPVAIVLGLLVRNFGPQRWISEAGLKFAAVKLLRLGIILIGLKLSFSELLRVGAWAAPAAAAVVLVGLVAAFFLARRMGLSAEMGALLAAGTSICGVSAVLCAAPVVRAAPRDTAYAVAVITIFGLLGMLLYPVLMPRVLESSAALGLFLGSAVHDTSQVVGAALTCAALREDDAVLRVATVTKLSRNLLLIVVIPLVGWYAARLARRDGDEPQRVSVARLVPLFVVGFAAMAAVRSIGDGTLAGGGSALGVFSEASWRWLLRLLSDEIGSQYCLATAMAAVGLGTRFGELRAVGIAPLIAGLGAAVIVALAALGMAVGLTAGGVIR
ncbi:MAG: putative sulfate exporter family transporter [Phycisphaerales bacterium]|nr:putative sulfate exporter family transporter [Phycisphaerales bacterium]